jgi:CDP-glycerol glycerophosphotransferase
MSPKISVVVPFHNVELYLQECLESLAAQTLTDLEVVMVDDGSTDNSAVIAKAFTDRDSRFRLVQRENQGPGLARNEGVRHALGEYLAFADGDDRVAPAAYESMVGSLDRTGSDLACGNVHRLNDEGRTWQSVLHGGVFRAAAHTHVSRHPLLLRDRTPWNKVFRRTFWDAHGFEFPAGSYEGPPVTTRAHVLATAVDVLDGVVYYWRKRTGSITEDHGDLDDLSQRMASAQVVRELIEACAPALLPSYDRHVLLDVELEVLFEALLKTAEENQVALAEVCGDLAGRISAQVRGELPAFRRLKLHLLSRSMLPELIKVLRFEQMKGHHDAPVVRKRWRWYASYPYFQDPSVREMVPDEVYDVTDEIKAEARVDRAHWIGDRLRIEGHAYLPGLEAAAPEDLRIKLWLLAGTRIRRVPVWRWIRIPIERVPCPEATASSAQALLSYDGSGFTAVLDPFALRLYGRWRSADWSLRVEVSARGLTRKCALGIPKSAGRRWPAGREIVRGIWIQPDAGRGQFQLQVRKISAMLTGHARREGMLELSGWAATDLGPDPGIIISRRGRAAGGRTSVRGPVEVSARPDGRHDFVARVPLADLFSDAGDRSASAPRIGHSTGWDIALTGGLKPILGCGETRQVVGGEEFAEQEFALTRTRAGLARGVLRAPRPVVDRLNWTRADALVVAGSYAGSDRPTALVLRRRRSSEERLIPLSWDGDRFSASFTPASLPFLGGARPLGAGRWVLLAAGFAGEVPVIVEREAIRNLPAPQVVGQHEVVAAPYRTDLLELRVRTALGVTERGAYAQRMLQSRDYPSFLRRPVRDLMVFDAYQGRQFSCNPRGIYEELRRQAPELEYLWVTADGQFTVPGARTVLVGSREHYAALAQASVIVGNFAQASWFSKRDDQTYVQCWHGTPLRKLGHDAPALPYERIQGVDWMQHDVPQWDLLISQNPFSTPLFRQAFRYDGEVLESGYPRNDPLHRPSRDLARKVRARLGIPADKRVVMYAPTWRDDPHSAVGSRRFSLELDLDAARRSLGDDHVMLLRTHHLVTDRSALSGHDGFVIDVSAYSDITELHLITDVLLTDYSSAMFDFAGTGKPMVFFTYDLEQYRDQARGFYLDFETEAPGPLLATSDEVISALRDIDQVARSHRGAYTAFVEKFCPYDDGHAAVRVVKRILQG